MDDDFAAQAVAIVIDTGPSVRNHDLETFERMRRVAREVALSRILYHSAFTERLGLIAIGSDDTKHDLEGYQGVEEIMPVGKVSPNILKEIENVKLGESGQQNDLVDALVIATVSLRNEVTKTQKKKKRIVFITDGETEIQDLTELHDHQIVKVTSTLVDQNIQVDIVCRKYISLEGYATCASDIDDDAGSEEVPTVAADIDKPGDGSREQLSNYLLGKFCRLERNKRKAILPGKALNVVRVNQSLMRRVAIATGGQVMSIDEALDDLARPNTKNTQSRCRFKGTLDLTSLFRIPVEVWAKTQKTEPPSAHRISWEATLKAWEPEDPEISDGQPVDPQTDRQSIVKILSNLTNISTVTNKAIDDPSEIVRAYRYGPDLLTIDDYVETSLEYKPGEKGLKAIGVVPLGNVPLHRIAGTVSMVVPMKGSVDAWNMLYPLAFNLAKRGNCLIASFVEKGRDELRSYSIATAPALVHIWGHTQRVKSEDGGQAMCRLYMAELPTSEGIRNVEQMPPIRSEPQKSLVAAYSSLIESATLSSEACKASITVNPSVARLNTAMTSRSLNGGRDGELLADGQTVAEQVLKPNLEVSSAADLKRIREAHPLQKKVKQAKKSAVLGDIEGKQNDDLSMYLYSDDEDDNDINFDWLSSDAKDLRLRSNYLAHDFESLVSNDNYEFAFSHITPEILHLISDSYKGDCFNEAKSCIDAFHRHSVLKNCYLEFNNLVELIFSASTDKDDQRRENFREFLKEHGAGLEVITADQISGPAASEAAQQTDELLKTRVAAAGVE